MRGSAQIGYGGGHGRYDGSGESSSLSHTDASLLYTALVQLGILARQSGLKLRQSYVRVGKRALIKVGRSSSVIFL
jgi:hypothetical protein